MGALAPHGHLVVVLLRSEENALLSRLVRVGGDAAGVTGRRVDRECTVDVTTSLIELDCLPSVLRSLTDSWPVLNSGNIRLLLVRLS